MDDKNPSSQLPSPQVPWGEPMTEEEVEKYFLAKVERAEHQLEAAIIALVIFFCKTNRPALGLQFMARLQVYTDDPEKNAEYLLTVGRLMEQMRDYEAAAIVYQKAFSLEPTNTETWYFINNNLGFSLNQLNRFEEAESYCRTAIEIDPERFNAYKNLGISMEGQGHYIAAAHLYIKAVQANASDSRAFRALENLLAEHEEILEAVPEMRKLVKQCKKAIERAEQEQQNYLDNINKLIGKDSDK